MEPLEPPLDLLNGFLYKADGTVLNYALASVDLHVRPQKSLLYQGYMHI